MSVLETPIRLPCGVEIRNRICKAAMTEGLADEYNRATPKHVTAYTIWAEGGSGLLLTGNVQIDRRYMERPGNVAIDGPQDEEQLERLRAYAAAGKKNSTHIWAQISHAGRQSNALVNTSHVGPGDIPVCQRAPGSAFSVVMSGSKWATPRPLTTEECDEIPGKFAHCAKVCQDTGFTGVQLHGAHGYLLSSFLNPLANNRTDKYGGSLENRARLLLDTVKEVRVAVGPGFPVSVKLNSADFQKGGLTHDEAMQVAEWLDMAGIDLLEVSGGNYESPAMMMGADGKEEFANAREAYFLDFAKDVRPRIKRAAVMVTGGFRSKQAMEEAISNGACDMVGVGRPLCSVPDAINKLLSGELDVLPSIDETLTLGPSFISSYVPGVKYYSKLLAAMWCQEQILQLGAGINPPYTTGLLRGFLKLQYSDYTQAKSLQGIKCMGLANKGVTTTQE